MVGTLAGLLQFVVLEGTEWQVSLHGCRGKTTLFGSLDLVLIVTVKGFLLRKREKIFRLFLKKQAHQAKCL